MDHEFSGTTTERVHFFVIDNSIVVYYGQKKIGKRYYSILVCHIR